MFNLNLFTEIQGNYLIRLLVAHLIADFILQTKKMVSTKKWFSKAMLLHIGILFIITLLFSQNLILSITISILHYITDGFKMELLKTKKYSETKLFILDQAIHLLVILICWAYYFNIIPKLGNALLLPFTNFNISLLLFSYILVTTPYGYFIGITTKRFQNKTNDETLADQNGFYIGIFERLIILTFMILGQYSAIGFLITGKSIIRYSAKNEDIKSEYVLLGTMISYGITIITGIVVKHLLNT
ncbi:DUF3307 domain-containing protein [Flavobacterium sp. SUN046]|uniref:DUF3307 domain-containing protein n=1 Tax=Flavobacterium sp. SUN046 TaxID=3002440 RepID=UPI002DB8F6D5|nr:DUF3307 domain-containing protein [Flavobacterium sp. SUN046]MEC4048725.1 DUF3307 domain-containing protein [Flavobacterium sp. SUN046]